MKKLDWLNVLAILVGAGVLFGVWSLMLTVIGGVPKPQEPTTLLAIASGLAAYVGYWRRTTTEDMRAAYSRKKAISLLMLTFAELHLVGSGLLLVAAMLWPQHALLWENAVFAFAAAASLLALIHVAMAILTRRRVALKRSPHA